MGKHNSTENMHSKIRPMSAAIPAVHASQVPRSVVSRHTHSQLSCDEVGSVCNASDLQHLPEIMGFYHVTAVGRWIHVVRQQLSVLNRSCLLHWASMHITLLSKQPVKDTLHLREELQRYHLPRPPIFSLPDFSGAPVWEPWTLQKMREQCLSRAAKGEPVLVFYLHNKGAGYITLVGWAEDRLGSILGIGKNKGVRAYTVPAWNEYMEYFLFENPRACIRQLTTQGKIACGVNLHRGINFSATARSSGGYPLSGTSLLEEYTHFSGNFWWSRCDHIIRQDESFVSLSPECKICGELWLLSSTTPSSPIANLWSSNVNHYKEVYPREAYATPSCPGKPVGYCDRGRPHCDDGPTADERNTMMAGLCFMLGIGAFAYRAWKGAIERGRRGV